MARRIKITSEHQDNASESVKRSNDEIAKSVDKVGKSFVSLQNIATDVRKNILSLAQGYLAFKGVQLLVTGVIDATKKLIDFTAEATLQSIENDRITRRRAVALKLASGATDEFIASLDQYNDAMLQKLGVDDDDLAATQAKLVQLDVSNEELKRATGFTIGLTEAGYSLETATRLVAKAYHGNFTALTKAGFAIKDGADAFREFTKLQESAESHSEDLGTQLNRLTQNLDNSKDAFGRLIAKSPLVIGFFKTLNDQLLLASNRFDKIVEGNDLVTGFLGNIAGNLGKAGAQAAFPLATAFIGSQIDQNKQQHIEELKAKAEAERQKNLAKINGGRSFSELEVGFFNPDDKSNKQKKGPKVHQTTDEEITSAVNEMIADREAELTKLNEWQAAFNEADEAARDKIDQARLAVLNQESDNRLAQVEFEQEMAALRQREALKLSKEREKAAKQELQILEQNIKSVTGPLMQVADLFVDALLEGGKSFTETLKEGFLAILKGLLRQAIARTIGAVIGGVISAVTTGDFAVGAKIGGGFGEASVGGFAEGGSISRSGSALKIVKGGLPGVDSINTKVAFNEGIISSDAMKGLQNGSLVLGNRDSLRSMRGGGGANIQVFALNRDELRRMIRDVMEPERVSIGNLGEI